MSARCSTAQGIPTGSPEALRVDRREGVGETQALALEEAVAGHSSLERVVRWAMMRGQLIDTVIQQDEYTLDVVVPAGDGLFLVYDTT